MTNAHILNDSGLDDIKVRSILDFAFRGIDMRGIDVTVREGEACAAYLATPKGSAAWGNTQIELGSNQALIEIAKHYPQNNLTSYLKTINHGPSDPLGLVDKVIMRYIGMGIHAERSEVRKECTVLKITHPYGGKAAPFIKIDDPNEALVVLGAHEACHVQQLAGGLPLDEVEAQTYAASRLEAYRAKEERKATRDHLSWETDEWDYSATI